MRKLTTAVLFLSLLLSLAGSLFAQSATAAPAAVSHEADCGWFFGGDSESDLDAQQVRTQSANENRTSVCNFDDFVIGDGGAGNYDTGNCFFHDSATGQAVVVCHSKGS
jgi:hypothetical protein